MASEKTILLTQPDWMGENRDKREMGKKKEDSRVRSSHFSLDFPAIGPTASARQEAKLIPTARATRGYRYWRVSTNSGR